MANPCTSAATDRACEAASTTSTTGAWISAATCAVEANPASDLLVLDGSMTLLLEAGQVVLRAGDGVVMPGVVHAWHAGPDGCRFSVVNLGLAPPG